MKNKFKIYLSLCLLRWLCVFDCLFSKHFKLKTYRKNGKIKDITELNSRIEYNEGKN